MDDDDHALDARRDDLTQERADVRRDTLMETAPSVIDLYGIRMSLTDDGPVQRDPAGYEYQAVAVQFTYRDPLGIVRAWGFPWRRQPLRLWSVEDIAPLLRIALAKARDGSLDLEDWLDVTNGSSDTIHDITAWQADRYCWVRFHRWVWDSEMSDTLMAWLDD